MALRPGFDPEQAERPAPNKKASRQRNVDLQHFLSLAGQRQPLVELPGTADLFSGDNLLAPPPTYGYDPSTPTSPGYFNDGSVTADILKHAGQQKTEYNPSDVQNARQKLIEALTAPDSANLTGMGGGANVRRDLIDAAVQGRNADRVEAAETVMSTAQRAERARAIGNTQADQGAGNIKKRTDELTDTEYNALPPLQKAAVDYNTLLADAVRKDRNNIDNYDPAPKQRDRYNTSVENMFGEDRGADGVYAPETVALLQKLGISDKAADLNDYLSLNATIKAKDLDNLKIQDLAPGTTAANAENQVLNPANPLGADRLALERSLATSTKQMEQQLAKGVALMSSINTTFKFQQNNLLEAMGGIRNDPKMGLGWNPPNWTTDASGGQVAADTNAKFIQGYNNITAAKNSGQIPAILSAMQSWLEPSEYNSFLDYLDQRSMNAVRFKQPLNDLGPGEKVIKAEQFRQMLGLDDGQPAAPPPAPAPAPAAPPARGGGY